MQKEEKMTIAPAITCPKCNGSKFSVFKKKKVSFRISISFCECDKCGQPFLYSLDESGKVSAVIKRG